MFIKEDKNQFFAGYYRNIENNKKNLILYFTCITCSQEWVWRYKREVDTLRIEQFYSRALWI